MKIRVWLPAGVGGISGVIALLTIAWPVWFEALTGESPDHGSGSTERWIAVGMLAVSLVALVVARIEWRRARRKATAISKA